MKLITVYRQKARGNEFLDKKQEVMWLENAIRQLEDILIYTSQKSKEYKEAYEQWCELNEALEIVETGEVKRLAHYDYV